MPSTDNYMIARGVLSVAEWSGGAPGVYVDVGNCPRFEVELTEQRLDHYSSRSQTRLKDKSVVLEAGYTVNFDLDEISLENLRMFLKASLSGTALLLANQELDKEYALRFVSDNAYGRNYKWEFWRVRLSPGGTFSLIGQNDWTSVSFTGEGLADTGNHADSPYMSVSLMTTTTTTTTT